MEKIKPFYKKNGFYDRLERFSDWADMFVYDYIFDFSWNIKNIGVWYYVPGMSNITWIEWRIRYTNDNLNELKAEYNRKKYWWMAAKK